MDNQKKKKNDGRANTYKSETLWLFDGFLNHGQLNCITQT
jgi:hypothetical protein